jgi:signal peptidase I
MNPDDRSDPVRSRRTRRLAKRLCHRARHRLRVEHDRLTESQRINLREAEAGLRLLNRSGATESMVGQGMGELQSLMTQAFPDRHHAPLRPAWEMFFVAVVIAITARTFFVQPFSVPTGSMEPTLQGIRSVDLRDDPDFSVPPWPIRLLHRLVHGTRYFSLIAQSDGMLEEVRPPHWNHPFAQYRFRIGSTWYRVPAGLQPYLERAGIEPDHRYQRGDPILQFQFTHGDFMFADRFTYNFRSPRRGEIVVFETDDIETLKAQHYYVKRLVAIGGDLVRIGNDRHLVVNDHRFNSSTPGFEAVYTSPNPEVPNAYLGHLNARVAAMIGLRRPHELAPLFPDESATFAVEPGHFMVMGDSTLFSLDSRAWGALPNSKIVGRAWLIYWPLSPRTGLVGP